MTDQLMPASYVIAIFLYYSQNLKFKTLRFLLIPVNHYNMLFTKTRRRTTFFCMKHAVKMR
jgi:hypothetical protein